MKGKVRDSKGRAEVRRKVNSEKGTGTGKGKKTNQAVMYEIYIKKRE